MPKAMMTHIDEYYLPDEEWFSAQLMSVTEREIFFFKKDAHGMKTNEESSFTKWVWEFKITEGEHQNKIVYVDTEDRLTSNEFNKVRQFGESLLQKELKVGDEFDTDSIVGLHCMIRVRHDPPRKTSKGMFYPCPVDEVIPANALDGEAPF